MVNNANSIKAGIIQFDVKTGDIDANMASMLSGVSRLNKNGAQLAVLPELWSAGFDSLPMVKKQADKTPQIIETLRELAKKHQMIIAGSLPEKFDNRLYNTMMVIDNDGSVCGRYRKVHLFSFIGEDKVFSAGSQAVVCNTSCGPIGMMICYDLRFPELCRSLAIAGTRVVIISAQWPSSRIHHWDTLLQARAIENQIFIVASNRVGKSQDLSFNGHSQIISPDGKVLVKISDNSDEACTKIDLNQVDIIRERFNCLTERQTSVYSHDIK